MLITNDDPRYYDFIKHIDSSMKLLLNKEFYFYGIFNNIFKIDDLVMEVLEDPNDGYRSSMGAVCHYASPKDVNYQFHKRPLAKVVLEKFEGSLNDTDDYYGSSDFNGCILRDPMNDHIWLAFGTDNADDYYPCFKFSYNPDRTQKDYISIPNDYVFFKEKYPEILIQSPDWFGGDRVKFAEY